MSSPPLLVLGSKNYSSWSLRAWIHLRKVGYEFREHVIPFDAADYRSQIHSRSPSGYVPVLIDSDLSIWDSLSICEYATEVTGSGLPRDRRARAIARSVCAEMHSAFAGLRETHPMNVRARNRPVDASAAALADIVRIDAIWCDCRARFGGDGDWLFGGYSLADAMFAPVAFRFRTYGAKLTPVAAQYLGFVLADPAMAEWSAACESERHFLPAVDRLQSV
jgi:glutathione S-transferase